MKYVKTFEDYEENASKPNTGDFALLYDEIDREDAEIVEIVGFSNSKYEVKFPTPPLMKFSCDLSAIKHFGTKAEMEEILKNKGNE